MKNQATPDNRKELIPVDEVQAAFMQRDDIKILPAAEQSRRWQKHLEGVNRFREMLLGMTCHVIPVGDPRS